MTEEDIYANEAEFEKLQKEDPVEFNKRLWAMRNIYREIFGDLPPYYPRAAAGLCEIEHSIETETEIEQDAPDTDYW